MGEGARRPEARCHPDRRGVNATGVWEESHAPYPGRSAHPPWWLASLRGEARGEQKSAEVVVAAAHGSEGPNRRSRVGSKRSMSEEDAAQKAEKPERSRKVGGGTAEDTTPARQALAARGDKAKAEAPFGGSCVLLEPPCTEPYARWCGSWGWATTPGYLIATASVKVSEVRTSAMAPVFMER